MMKKILLLFCLLSSIQLFSQTENRTLKHEAKINVIYALGGYVLLGYEHILNEESSIGLDVGFPFIKDDLPENFSVTPYYRWFFGKKPAAGFLLEGNASIYSRRRYERVEGNFGPVTELDPKIGAGLGLSAGYKFMLKSHFTVEILLGMGRNFVNTDDIPKLYSRGGVLIGKRF